MQRRAVFGAPLLVGQAARVIAMAHVEAPDLHEFREEDRGDVHSTSSRRVQTSSTLSTKKDSSTGTSSPRTFS